MRAQRRPTTTAVEKTYKAREVEGLLDLYFYRKFGYWLARLFARLRIPPSRITLLGGLFGIVAGHLYYYLSLRTNLFGMLLHVCANALDNADGQLARMTGRQSQNGRIFDGLIDYVIFVSIYLHLGLRCIGEGFSPSLWLLVVAAAVSHALQSAAADYSRNAYLYFACGKGEFDSSDSLLRDYDKLSWSRQPGAKFLQRLYLNMTREQEFLAPGLHRLRQRLKGAVPSWFQARYRASVQPTLRRWGLLMTNTRMIVLFLLLFIRRPIFYFWFELIPLNLLLAYLLFRQQIMSKSFAQQLEPAT